MIYRDAAEILEKLDQEKGTVKSLCLNYSSKNNAGKKQQQNNSKNNVKRLFALVCESLKYREAIIEILDCSGILKTKTSPKLSKTLWTVLVYDLLFGQGVGSAGPFKDIVIKNKTRLTAELAKLKIRRRVKDNAGLIPEHIRNQVVLPRYARVNTLITSTEEVISVLSKQGYRLVESTNDLSNIESKSMLIDKHIPNILILPSNTDFHDHQLLKDGHIILQDKASCFPAHILNPPLHAKVIDACSAPGNKTSHLSAIMQNTGTIFAFDQDAKRLQTLIKLTGRAGCKNIKPLHTSFLDINPNDSTYKDVEYILLDPSCSGSGIVRRLDHLVSKTDELETEVEEFQSRVGALADFQVSVLLHAFKFPKVKRVVYSTCSKHVEENENVIKKVLQEQSVFGICGHKDPKTGMTSSVFPSWKRRGLPVVDGYEHLIRTESTEDFVIGFFVALFERKSI